MSNFKIGDTVIYTEETKPVLINPLHTRKGRISGFYNNEIIHVKFEDGTDGIIHIKNLKLQEAE